MSKLVELLQRIDWTARGLRERQVERTARGIETASTTLRAQAEKGAAVSIAPAAVIVAAGALIASSGAAQAGGRAAIKAEEPAYEPEAWHW